MLTGRALIFVNKFQHSLVRPPPYKNPAFITSCVRGGSVVLNK